MIMTKEEMEEVAKAINCRYCGEFKGGKATIHIFNDDFKTGRSFGVISPTVPAEIEFEINQLRRQQQEVKC